MAHYNPERINLPYGMVGIDPSGRAYLDIPNFGDSTEFVFRTNPPSTLNALSMRATNYNLNDEYFHLFSFRNNRAFLYYFSNSDSLHFLANGGYKWKMNTGNPAWTAFLDEGTNNEVLRWYNVIASSYGLRLAINGHYNIADIAYMSAHSTYTNWGLNCYHDGNAWHIPQTGVPGGLAQIQADVFKFYDLNTSGNFTELLRVDTTGIYYKNVAVGGGNYVARGTRAMTDAVTTGTDTTITIPLAGTYKNIFLTFTQTGFPMDGFIAWASSTQNDVIVQSFVGTSYATFADRGFTNYLTQDLAAAGPITASYWHIYLKECYISGTNLILVIHNGDTTTRNLAATLTWKAW